MAASADGFLQDPPRLGNQYAEDEYLRSQMQRLLPAGQLRRLERDLERFGWEVATSIKSLGFQAEEEPPYLRQSDAWGKRVDTVVTSPAWRQQKGVSAREGLVAIAYERQQGQYSRIYQMAKLVLYGASSGLFNCPLAMTDGAARVCELQRAKLPELEEAYSHLSSRDPAKFWTSGQWMTEKAGGSDVSAATETLAVPEDSGRAGVGGWFRLHGYKWFTSAADGEMAFALARECGPSCSPIPGNRGLALFFVPVERDAEGCPKGFQIVRLKNKLGTRQLPTAELRLQGMRALKVSELGRGVPTIAAMVNITRVHNAAAAVSYMRRMTALAQDYARRRVAFGAPLSKQPLALRTLAWLELHTCAGTALLFEVARLLGLQETGQATPGDASLLRLLTPLAKLFTAKEAVAVASEGLEFFGGQGYIEDTHIPGILRDAQVLPIWEGSTNVLCLDMLRVLGGDPAAVPAFLSSCAARLASAAAAAAAGTAGLGTTAAGAAATRIAAGAAATRKARKGAAIAAGGANGPATMEEDAGAAARGTAAAAWSAAAGSDAAAAARGAKPQAAESNAVAGPAGAALPAVGISNSSGQPSSASASAAHAALVHRLCGALGDALHGLEQALLPTAALVQGGGRGAGLPLEAQAGARELAFLLTRTFVAVLLLEHAAWSGSPRHLLLAAEWCRQEVCHGGPFRRFHGASVSPSRAGYAGESAAAEASTEGGSNSKEQHAWWEAGRLGLGAARVIARVDEPLLQPRARF